MRRLSRAASPIRRVAGGFADFTITRRFPKIATAVLAEFSGRTEARQIERLADDVIGGGPIDAYTLECPTPFWTRYVDELRGASWGELPFFDLEFVFYHAINSIAGSFTGGLDVFRRTRLDALQGAIASLTLVKALPTNLPDAVWLALTGNEADYSQLAPGRAVPTNWSDAMVVDERVQLLAELNRTADPHEPVHIIADNAGPELLADLVLADVLLRRAEDERLVMHCKPWPMFVSDALVADVHVSVEALRASTSDALVTTGERLDRALASGRLRAEAHVAWGEPRHFDELDSDLISQLRESRAVVAKGDLNYRRFVGDCDWPTDTPAAIASRGVPFRAYALRVLKSDALVGVAPEVTASAAARNAAWRTDGSRTLIQRLGGT